MKTSEKIKTMIKAWEGCRLKAYKCPAGVWTIGYGHTEGVKAGMTITKQQADAMFEEEIEKFEKQVRPLVTDVTLTQNQYDALVSMAYNIGVGALRNSTLLKKVKANPDDPTIRTAFMQWVRGGGKILPGLQKRREMEANHYFSNSGS